MGILHKIFFFYFFFFSFSTVLDDCNVWIPSSGIPEHIFIKAFSFMPHLEWPMTPEFKAPMHAKETRIEMTTTNGRQIRRQNSLKKRETLCISHSYPQQWRHLFHVFSESKCMLILIVPTFTMDWKITKKTKLYCDHLKAPPFGIGKWSYQTCLCDLTQNQYKWPEKSAF